MPVSTSSEFSQAVVAFQEGRLEDARASCENILQAMPEHAACMHLMGALEQGQDKLEAAETWMRRALALNGNFSETHYSFALVLAARGKHDEAAEEFRQTIQLNPQHAAAYFGLGNALKVLGQTSEAGKALAQAIVIKPNYLDALNSLGVLFCEQRMFDEAQACFESALGQGAPLPETLNNLAVVCFERGQFIDAQDYGTRALQMQPDYPAALINLGNALKAQGKWSDAIRSYGRALTIDPDNTEARNNIGLATLHGLGDVELAAAHFRYVLARSPHHVPALSHLGITHCYRGDFDEGLACYEQALALQPGYHEARNNLGNALRSKGRLDDAMAAYEQVVGVQPGNADAHHNLALAYLQTGRFAEGWKEFEWRWQTPQLASGARHFTQPQWRGEDAEGRVLLIHAEQGFGDTLQFCRYASLAAARGLRVVLEVQPELVRLLESLAGVERVIGRGQALPEFDLHCPMMSLPLAFDTRMETIPSGPAYLAPHESDIDIWRQRASEDEGKLKVGLAWAGNPRRFSVDLSAADKRRSIAPEKLASLTQIPGIRFFNLQKDLTPPENLGLENYMQECRDFADTAALISQLDLVISVDTAVAHLAAALGKPVWLLNRFDTCWRWLMLRDNSPWYTTLRLFRQAQPGVWDSPIAQVHQRLMEIGKTEFL